MRILGGHDYYDSALGYGQDEDLVFVRDNKTISTDKCPLWSYYPHNISCGIAERPWHYGERDSVFDKKHGRLELSSVSVYAAGVRYGGIAATSENKQVFEVFWNLPQLESWLLTYNFRIFKPKKESYKWQSNRSECDEFPNLQSWFTPTPASPDQLTWLIDNRVVTAVCSHKVNRYNYSRITQTWHCNSADKEWALKELGFARAVDPYTLFQEISMFIGGVLPRNPNPMVEITDTDVKVAKHGFDKWSFRKHKDDPIRQKE